MGSEPIVIAEAIFPQRSEEYPWKMVCAVAPVSTIFPVNMPVISQEAVFAEFFGPRQEEFSWICFL